MPRSAAMPAVAPTAALGAPVVAIDPDVSRTVEMLGGPEAIPRPVRTPLEAHDLLAGGLPASTLFHLAEETGLGPAMVMDVLGMSVRTLQRRRDDQGRALSAELSGRAWLLAEVVGRATEIFGSKADALAWLQAPALALDGRRPIDLLRTPAGAEVLGDHLTRLEYGVYT